MISSIRLDGRTACMALEGTTDTEAFRVYVREVLTRDPICIRDSALASDALAIFNERNIDDLIVINAKREPVGMIDLQDLPKLKLL